MFVFKKLAFVLLLGLVATLSVSHRSDKSIGQELQVPDDAELLFVRRVLPLLAEKCWGCHGQDPAELAGGLDLRSREFLLRGGDSQQSAMLIEQPDASPLYLATTRTHDTWSPMPPKESEQLTPEQKQWLCDWISHGAPWPDEARQTEIARDNAVIWSAEDGVTLESVTGQSADWSNRKYKLETLWAFQPVVKPEIPHNAASHPQQSQHPMDAFLEARWPKQLRAAPTTDARTLIRRMTFDLTGLPPSPDDITLFESRFEMDAESAVNQLVDCLLASPHYGERMAQHWLDVVRYADSSGFANDFERGNAWRFRDYVVRSFNDDKPYDQFVREQIAGDEIDPLNSEYLIATGFLRMGPWELTAMEVAKVARQRFLDDVVNSVGETFLAQPLQCARCHDHKFDPIPTTDYYRIQAVFATTQQSEREAAFLPDENTAGFDEQKYLEASRAEHMGTLRRLDEKSLAAAKAWFAENQLDPANWNAAVQQTQARDPNNLHLFSVARSSLQRQEVPDAQIPPRMLGWSPEEIGLERIASKGLERLTWELERYQPYALAVYSGRTPQVSSVVQPVRLPADAMEQGQLEETCVLAGGDPFSPSLPVRPGVLSIIESVPSPAIPDAIKGRRFAFAQWVTSPQNPLTSRVIVNRIWLWHFNQALAGNPNNFGVSGQRPSHPELLDWLATSFVENSWSIKSLHRLIMTSQAYRRSTVHPDREVLTEHDPLGTSFAVFKPRRLSAEELRDAMLAASGELNLTLGGIPNRPEINQEVAFQPRQVMGTIAAAWVPNPLPVQRHRRSLYAQKLRGLSDPAMEVFNAPPPDFSCERRETSTVTPQVFTLFNGQSSHARALALAARVVRETDSDDAAIQRLFALLYGREAKDIERDACMAHWRKMQVVHFHANFERQRPPLEVRREAIEENTGEAFSFTERLWANADFVSDLQPSDCDVRTRALADVALVLLNTNEFMYVY